MKFALLLCLAVVTLIYIVAWAIVAHKQGARLRYLTNLPALATGAFANFFDTLGIGSFATTTGIFKFTRMVRDEHIPGTLNAGHALPSIAQAFIYIVVVEVDFWTLLVMIAAATLGAWFGAGLVAAWPRRKVQIGMGLALCGAATIMIMGQLKLVPVGGQLLSLPGVLLWVGAFGNFLLGALMTIGIGLYAPCMILVSLLGMDARAAFPIMMGSCAFLMPFSGWRFIKAGSYDMRTAIGMAIGGVPAVLVAAFIVRSLPLDAVRWLVIVVVVYTAGLMLRSAMREARAPRDSRVQTA